MLLKDRPLRCPAIVLVKTVHNQKNSSALSGTSEMEVCETEKYISYVQVKDLAVNGTYHDSELRGNKLDPRTDAIRPLQT